MKFQAPPDHWQEFILCLAFHMILPLSPLGLELLFTQKLSNTSLTICASIYSVSIGSSSRNRLLFGLAIFSGMIFASMFGVAIKNNQVPFCKLLCLLDIFSIFLFHGIERYYRHVVNEKPYWEWIPKS
ncbi:MAG: hypothetical protein AB1611_14505 [bacterium]